MHRRQQPPRTQGDGRPRLVTARRGTARYAQAACKRGKRMTASLTRREFLGAGAAVGAAVTLGPIARRLPAVPAIPSKPAKLSDIEHVVIMMQENRSFDHYFGRLGGVRGFGDRRDRKSFAQPDGAGGAVYPFHIDAAATGG